MGLDYNLYCIDCNETSRNIEFSIVTERWQLKHWNWQCEPDGLPDFLDFLCAHSGHRLKFRDSKGNVTKPHEKTGKYVLGLEE